MRPTILYTGLVLFLLALAGAQDDKQQSLAAVEDLLERESKVIDEERLGFGITIMNSGDAIALTQDSPDDRCTFLQQNATLYFYDRYLDSSSHKGNCYLEVSTSEPRYVTLTVSAISIPKYDRFYLTSVGRRHTTERIMDKHQGSVRLLPSSSFSLQYRQHEQGLGFVLRFYLGNNECQQLILMQALAFGKLSLTRYPRGTVCEYWIEAPEGFGVAMYFTYFNIGRREHCLDDFMQVDRSGDHKFVADTTKYCNGGPVPTFIHSSGNKMSILVNGIKSMEDAGFTAYYTTFPLQPTSAT